MHKLSSLPRSAVFLIAASAFLIASVAAAEIISGTFSTNSSSDVTITEITISKPASVVEGDFLLASIAINGGSPASVTSVPAGWTQVLRTDNDTNISIVSYYKVAGASEPANYSWNISPQTRAEGGIVKYGGVDATNPIDNAAGNIGLSQTATTSSITTSSPNEEIVTLFATDVGKNSDAGAYFSEVTGMTEKFDVSNITLGPSIALDDGIQAAEGSSGSKSSTISGSKNRNWVSQIIALKPLITPAECSGGTITHVGGNTTHTFTAVGTSTLDCTGMGSSRSAKVLIVAGGGGGSELGEFGGSGGGGGAGGYQYDGSFSLTAAAYTVVVGTGGEGGSRTIATHDYGLNGGNSQFGTIVSVGGGGGGSNNGLNGGSGGGGGGTGNSGIGGSGIAGQGNNGGNGANSGGYVGGGGGGASSPGLTGASGVGGNGGDGISTDISGATAHYAGGGGGGSGGTTAGTGGAGGGGNGSLPGSNGSDGAPNTGGGGGGGGNNASATLVNGGSGGSGIVIISYPTP